MLGKSVYSKNISIYKYDMLNQSLCKSVSSELVDRALQCGFNSGADYLVVWSTYCDYLRRRIKWNQGEHLETTVLSLVQYTLMYNMHPKSYYNTRFTIPGTYILKSGAFFYHTLN